MIIEHTENIVEYPGVVIAHGVNARGKMGAGVARIISEKYPTVLEPYQKACADGMLKPGGIQVIQVSPERWIANLCTQDDYGKEPSRRYASIQAVIACLEKLTAYLKERNISAFAMPRVGCNLGGLDWETEVRPVVERFAKDMEIHIYDLPGEEYRR